VVGVDPIASLLLPPPTGRMRNVSQQVKQQAAGKSNSRLPQVRARGQVAWEREREDNAAIAIASNNNTKYRAAGGAFFQLSVPSGAAVAQTAGY